MSLRFVWCLLWHISRRIHEIVRGELKQYQDFGMLYARIWLTCLFESSWKYRYVSSKQKQAVVFCFVLYRFGKYWIILKNGRSHKNHSALSGHVGPAFDRASWLRFQGGQNWVSRTVSDDYHEAVIDLNTKQNAGCFLTKWIHYLSVGMKKLLMILVN